MEFLPEDWLSILSFDTPLLELVARGSVLYFGILVMTRLMPRRTGGELAMMDLIFVLLIAEAAAHAMGEYTSVADGIVMVATFMGWNYLINALSYRVPFIERLVSSPPLQVIKDGKLLRRNMRREFLTEEELMSHLREEGIGDVKEVKSAHIEGDGKISVISKRR
ncbi:YetF domain-containing protein [Microvirga sp. 0TCS3.31]|jgi:uncharacterized membrane protein YcaP (DUF421 family)